VGNDFGGTRKRGNVVFSNGRGDPAGKLSPQEPANRELRKKKNKTTTRRRKKERGGER